ncbi:hypothetical protein MBLNU230_g4935t1 [Neophaeotheca triangularis]
MDDYYNYSKRPLTYYPYRRHAEPEQAAQMLGGASSSQAPPAGRSHSSSNSSAAGYNKPIPPPPQQQQTLRPQDPYARPPPNQGYSSPGPIPGSYGSSNPPPTQQTPNYGGNDPYNRQQPSPRYDQYSQPNRYNSPQPPPNNPSPQPYTNSNGTAPPPPPNRPSYASPPPPASYGQGPPPQTHHNRPPIPNQHRPPTTGPPQSRDPNDREALWPLFQQVDKDRSGQLSESELRRALVNGDYTAFDPHTVKMMIRMFDTDRSGKINFDEFCGLWGFLAAWRGLFDRFDVDRSGNISLREFEDALVAFGYRLSPQFVQLLFTTYAKGRTGGRGDEGWRERVLSFDLFVQACISLKRMTDVFKKYDEDRDGYITLSL